MINPVYRCIGRVVTSQYTTQRGFEYRKSFNVLRRKSTLSVDDVIDVSLMLPINFFDVEDGIYELTATNVSRDFETGIIDDWDVELTPMEEASNE